MGKRGPKQTPTELKLVRGTRKDRINKDEPQPQELRAECPEVLSDRGREIWERLAPQLESRKCLYDWDREAFAVFCETYAHWEVAAEDVTRNGVVILEERQRYTRTGDLLGTDHIVKKNPAVQVEKDLAGLIRQYASEFGLTPSGRADIKVPSGSGGISGHQDPRRLLS